MLRWIAWYVHHFVPIQVYLGAYFPQRGMIGSKSKWVCIFFFDTDKLPVSFLNTTFKPRNQLAIDYLSCIHENTQLNTKSCTCVCIDHLVHCSDLNIPHSLLCVTGVGYIVWHVWVVGALPCWWSFSPSMMFLSRLWPFTQILPSGHSSLFPLASCSPFLRWQPTFSGSPSFAPGQGAYFCLSIPSSLSQLLSYLNGVWPWHSPRLDSRAGEDLAHLVSPAPSTAFNILVVIM